MSIKNILGDKTIAPAFRFHSVGLNKFDWIFSHLSAPLDYFEELIRILKHSGYNFIFWSELYNHMAGLKKVKSQSVMLTFDDGYLDNWVYVYPLLRKYDIKATIFITPEFVDSPTIVRPTNETIEPVQPNEAAGFLSWEEMRQMEASGLVDIQSHALTHTWYFSSEKIVDFHHPGDRYPWLAWNVRVDRKPYYMTEEQSSFVPYGAPIFQYEKSLVCRRFFPFKNIYSEICEFAASKGDKFWTGQNWLNRLMKEWRRLEKKGELGYYESDTEYRQRVKKELTESKRIISEQLNKEVDFICWPGGGYNQTALKIAKEAGYKSWTISSKDQIDFRNRPRSNAQQVKRIGSSTRIFLCGKALGYGNAEFFYHTVRAHQGDLISKIWIKFYKLLRLILFWISKIAKSTDI